MVYKIIMAFEVDKKITHWMGEIVWLKVLLSGFAYTVIVFLVHQIEALTLLKYFVVPTLGMPPVNDVLIAFVLNMVTGASITLIYYYLRSHLPTGTKYRVLYFADLMTAFYLVFFSLSAFRLFAVPIGLLVFWFVTNFVIFICTSWVLVKINK